MKMLNSLWHCRWIAVWQRNFYVWQHLFFSALVGNFVEPLLYLLGLGYGLGSMVGQVDNVNYLAFLASGVVCSSGMQTATFEALYSSYTRMDVQHTWNSMLVTPLDIHDVLWGEVLWSATKSIVSVICILIVASMLDIVHSWQALWILPIMFLVGICFSALGLVVTALARSYEFFLYYMTLCITPMVLISGIFFPISTLPTSVQMVAKFFPLIHAIELTRPLIFGQQITFIAEHLSVILLYIIGALATASYLLNKRFSS
jgi:lipooligosaccharide transport system permease protein